MKKLIPILVSGILVVGIFGCQDATKTGSETPGTTNEAVKPAKEATQKTDTAAKGGAEAEKTTKTTAKGTAETAKQAPANAAAGTTKSSILSKLEASIPGSKLVVEDQAGAVTVKGTVPTEADVKKIEPLVKPIKGVKSVKVEAKAAPKKP
jgi:hyperosmotically inducible protein